MPRFPSLVHGGLAPSSRAGRTQRQDDGIYGRVGGQVASTGRRQRVGNGMQWVVAEEELQGDGGAMEIGLEFGDRKEIDRGRRRLCVLDT